MAKKIRFALEMANGVEVRSVDELKDNFSLEQILMYYSNGKLVTWLRDRYEDDIANAIEELVITDTDFQKKLCTIFDIEYDENNKVDLEAAAEKERKLKLLTQYSDEQRFIDNIDLVAFEQDDIYGLLDEEATTIYLCGEKFSIPLGKNGITYIGVNNPVVVINSKEPVNFEEKRITFENIEYDEAYQALIVQPNEEEILRCAENLFFDERYKEAFEKLNSISNTNGRACFILSGYYRNCYGTVNVDKTKSNSLIFSGIDLGDTLCKVFCALNDLVPKDKKNMYITSCISEIMTMSENDVFALDLLSECYYHGVGVAKDLYKAYELFSKAADKGYVDSIKKLGVLTEMGKGTSANSKEAVELYVKASKMKDVEATEYVGSCYKNGIYFNQNYSEALEYFKLAANFGQLDALNQLGIMYDNGYGVSCDYEKAFEFFTKAAEGGYAAGWYNLGSMYECYRGIGAVYSDEKKAIECYIKAAELDYVDAMLKLGWLYGRYVGKESMSFKWYLKAAEAGNANAQYEVAHCYSWGRGVEQNYEMDIYWYKKAAEQGHEGAQQMVWQLQDRSMNRSNIPFIKLPSNR